MSEYSVYTAKNGFVLEDWDSPDGHNTDKYIFTEWSEVLKWLENNPLR